MMVLFLAGFSLAAKCGLEIDGRRIVFMDSTLWWQNTYLFWGAVFILEDGYNCEKGEYEKAFLDSNTYIQRILDGGKKWLIIGQNSLSAYGIGEVFRDEFLHWQKCGMLDLTYEQADSIAMSLAEAMSLRDSSYYEMDLFYLTEYPPMGGGMPQQFVDWASEDCRTASIEKRQSRSTDPILFDRGLVQISKSLQGENYFVFDMNGKVVQKGVAGETIRVSILPSIFKIGEGRLFLLK